MLDFVVLGSDVDTVSIGTHLVEPSEAEEESSQDNASTHNEAVVQVCFSKVGAI